MVCLMGRNNRTFNSLYRLTIGLFLGLLVVSVAYAATYDVTPTSVTYSQRTPSGASTRAAFESSFNGQTRHHTQMVPLSKGTAAGLARAFAKRAVPAYMGYQAFKSLLDGAGWAIDELSKQVVTPGQDPDQMAPGTTQWCTTTEPKRCSSTLPGLADAMLSVYGGTDGWEIVTQHANQATVRFRGVIATVFLKSTVTVWTPDFGTGSSAQEITDTQLADLVLQSPQVINAILIDGETGAPIRTPELVAAMNALRQALEAGNSSATPGDDVVSGDLANPQPMESAWPMFCSWATTVCDFIDWVRTEPAPEPSPPEVPWEIAPPDPTVEWSSGLGAGSCPAPYSFSVSLGGYTSSPEFSVQPICDFAVIMRPVILAISVLMAGYILAGLRGAKDA